MISQQKKNIKKVPNPKTPRVKKSRVSGTEKSSNEKSQKIIHWVQCEACYKWRKIPAGHNKAKVKEHFYCNFFGGNTCETLEESWRRHYTTISKD